MIELTAYTAPKSGERFTTKKVWINSNLITHMGTFEARAERESSGRYLDEMLTVTSIFFSARDEEAQAGVIVIDTPQQVLEQIHYLRLREKEY